MCAAVRQLGRGDAVSAPTVLAAETGRMQCAGAREPQTSDSPLTFLTVAQLPACIGVHNRNPEWRRNAKQSLASVPMRSKPCSATSATSSIVSRHKLANSRDFRLPHASRVN